VKFGQGGLVYALNYAGNDIYISIDSGTSWTHRTIPQFVVGQAIFFLNQTWGLSET